MESRRQRRFAKEQRDMYEQDTRYIREHATIADRLKMGWLTPDSREAQAAAERAAKEQQRRKK